MSPEVKEAIEVRDSLVHLLQHFKLFDEDFCMEINIYDLISNNDYITRAGITLMGKEFWNEPAPSVNNLKKLMRNIQKLTGIKVKYEIDERLAYPTCFFELTDLHKLHAVVYSTARMYK